LGQKEAYELKKLVSQKGEIVVFFSEMWVLTFPELSSGTDK
jgi:hypothetical protein